MLNFLFLIGQSTGFHHISLGHQVHLRDFTQIRRNQMLPAKVTRPTKAIVPSLRVGVTSCMKMQETVSLNFYPIVGLIVLIGYHVQLFIMEKNGVKSWRKAQADMREKWAKYVRETEAWLYAVQTLRNAITANTFLATTVLSLLTLIAGRLWDIVRKSAIGAVGRDRLLFQLTTISTCMLVSAYEFLQSARLMTHAGFMFPVASGNKVDKIVRKSQNAQWKGLRFLYLSVGAVAWTLGGDKFFFSMTLLLVYFFKRVDKPPLDN